MRNSKKLIVLNEGKGYSACHNILKLIDIFLWEEYDCKFLEKDVFTVTFVAFPLFLLSRITTHADIFDYFHAYISFLGKKFRHFFCCCCSFFFGPSLIESKTRIKKHIL